MWIGLAGSEPVAPPMISLKSLSLKLLDNTDESWYLCIIICISWMDISVIDRSSIEGAFCTGIFLTFWILGLLSTGLCLSRVAAVLMEVPSEVLMDIFSLKSWMRFKFLLLFFTLGGMGGLKSYSISPDMNSLELGFPSF